MSVAWKKKLNQLCEGYYLKLSLSRGQRSTNDSSVTAVLGVANATITKWFCTLHSVNFQITPNYSNYYCLESVEKLSEGKIQKSEPEPRNGKLHKYSLLHSSEEYSNSCTKFVYGDLFTCMDFDTMIYLFVKPQLLMKNVDFSNRQRYKVS